MKANSLSFEPGVKYTKEGKRQERRKSRGRSGPGGSRQYGDNIGGFVSAYQVVEI